MFLYGNYTGDVMNFDMAAEACAAVGIDVRSVAVTDDVASAAIDRIGERRGIAGDFFVFKIAGAAGDEGLDLEAVVALAGRANDATRSMGVALSACSMPQTAVPNFDVAPGMMEVGMGQHGEPGVASVPLENADAVIDRILNPIVEELALGPGCRVAVLLNGLGATSQLELFILFRRVAAELSRMGVVVEARWVGEYATSLEMAGASLSILRLDDDLARLLARPCHTPALKVGITVDRPAVAHTPRARVTEIATFEPTKVDLKRGGTITPSVFRTLLRAAPARISRDRDWLSQLDGAIGDGDHKVTMDIGWQAILSMLDALPDNASIREISHRSGEAFLGAVGASCGPLYATAFFEAGCAVADRHDLDAGSLAEWIEGMARGIEKRGGAVPGNKTMIDAWVPAAEAARSAANGGGDEVVCLSAACDAALLGYRKTSGMHAARGRSAKLGDRALGHPDPGAASAWAILDAASEMARNIESEAM